MNPEQIKKDWESRVTVLESSKIHRDKFVLKYLYKIDPNYFPKLYND